MKASVWRNVTAIRTTIVYSILKFTIAGLNFPRGNLLLRSLRRLSTKDLFVELLVQYKWQKRPHSSFCLIAYFQWKQAHSCGIYCTTARLFCAFKVTKRWTPDHLVPQIRKIQFVPSQWQNLSVFETLSVETFRSISLWMILRLSWREVSVKLMQDGNTAIQDRIDQSLVILVTYFAWELFSSFKSSSSNSEWWPCRSSRANSHGEKNEKRPLPSRPGRTETAPRARQTTETEYISPVEINFNKCRP